MKLSEIVASLNELKATVAGWVKDKAAVTADTISGFQTKLSTLETGAVSELTTALSSLTAEQGKSAALTTEKTDLTSKLTAEEGKVSALTAEKTDLTSKLTAATNADANKQTAIEAANVKLANFLKALKQTVPDGATLEQNVEATTKAITAALAAQGIKVDELAEAAPGTGGESGNGSILAQYEAEQAKGPKEGAAFYAKNQKAIDTAWYANLKK